MRKLSRAVNTYIHHLYILIATHTHTSTQYISFYIYSLYAYFCIHTFWKRVGEQTKLLRRCERKTWLHLWPSLPTSWRNHSERVYQLVYLFQQRSVTPFFSCNYSLEKQRFNQVHVQFVSLWTLLRCCLGGVSFAESLRTSSSTKLTQSWAGVPRLIFLHWLTGGFLRLVLELLVETAPEKRRSAMFLVRVLSFPCDVLLAVRSWYMQFSLLRSVPEQRQHQHVEPAAAWPCPAGPLNGQRWGRQQKGS